MELKWTKDGIEFDKELNDLDTLAFSFCEILNKHKINYVIVSGYVAILFGRSRSSEDIDLFVESIPFEVFNKIWSDITAILECISTTSVEEAYYQYLKKQTAIRFARKGKYVPNIEIKFPKLDLDRISLNNRQRVIVNGKEIFVSPFEIQIAFKLYLGSEKDIEDARYMYKLFKDKLNIALLHTIMRNLNIPKEYERYVQ